MEIKTSPKRRKCKHKTCDNILSIYNHEAYCHVHLSQDFLKENINPKTADKSVKK